MILLTSQHRDRLLANGREPDADHAPVVKFFNPFGAGVWLATELDTGGDIMFGLADLGYPELGFWSFDELRYLRLPFGLEIERDLHFASDLPISIWAEAARETGSIRGAEQLLSIRAGQRPSDENTGRP